MRRVSNENDLTSQPALLYPAVADQITQKETATKTEELTHTEHIAHHRSFINDQDRIMNLRAIVYLELIEERQVFFPFSPLDLLQCLEIVDPLVNGRSFKSTFLMNHFGSSSRWRHQLVFSSQ